ncbi:MAG: DUF3516 domain-containing protein [Lawsonella clevelandensis]
MKESRKSILTGTRQRKITRAEYDDIVTDSDARSARFITITPSPDGTTWDVRQTICDPEENHSWVIDAVVDSALSNERGEVYFRSLDVKDLTRS